MKSLRGTHTALVTPMNLDGSIDFGALNALVDRQLEAGISGLVPCGTTGEAATLSLDERTAVIEAVVKRVSGKVPVIAGTGGNSTAGSIENQRRAKDVGADFGLLVTPYYNKPTPEGLFLHYTAVAEAVDLPIVLYNVPGRTGCDMRPSVVTRLSQNERIVGIKDASCDLARIKNVREQAPLGFAFLSGEDSVTCPLILLGGDGVISVTSNLAPGVMVAMVNAALGGDVEEARRQHDALQPLFEALFFESNPIPVKTALSEKGLIQDVFRLPLCSMMPENRRRLADVVAEGGW